MNHEPLVQGSTFAVHELQNPRPVRGINGGVIVLISVLHAVQLFSDPVNGYSFIWSGYFAADQSDQRRLSS